MQRTGKGQISIRSLWKISQMTRSLGGNVTPLGAQRRRLAPLTGSAVLGAGDPAPQAPPQQGRLLSARVWRRHTVSSRGFLRTFTLPGLKSSRPRPHAEYLRGPGRANRKSAAERPPTHPNRKRRRRWRRWPVRPGAREASARVPGASRLGWCWPGTCRPPVGLRPSPRTVRPRRRGSEGLRSAPSPHLPGKSPT